MITEKKMDWISKNALEDFNTILRLADVQPSDISLEYLPAPHELPTLPAGKRAIYIFMLKGEVLKICRSGRKSGSLYGSHHYELNNMPGTLAGLLIADAKHFNAGGGVPNTLAESSIADAKCLNIGKIENVSSGECDEISKWIWKNVCRFDFFLDENLDASILSLLEVFLKCRLKPRYEGQKNQY